jgi:glutamate-1-semialdehyde 2,1-aminomutase
VNVLAEQIGQGTSFGITTPYEQELAAKITWHLPSIDKLRFVSSGTEATMTAIRLARGWTGKNLLVKFDGHYHGHSDGLLIQAGSGVTHLPRASSLGIPPEIAALTISLPFNDIEVCRAFLRSQEGIAAVILEPVAGNMGVVPALPEFLQMLREETERLGIVLIFDEVITGFRVALHGAQGHYGITPDLTCLGKIIGGGLPAAAVGGRKEIMDLLAPLGPVYQAGTLSGSPLAMRAGLATLAELEKPGFYADLERKMEALLDPLKACIKRRHLQVALQHVGSMFTLFFGVEKVESRVRLDEERFKDFFRTLFDQGIYLSPSAYEAHFVSSAHTEEHLADVQRAILAYLEKL